MPRNENYYKGLALAKFAECVLEHAIAYLKEQPIPECGNLLAISELMAARNRVQIDVSYCTRRLQSGTRRWEWRNDYKKTKKVAI